MEDGGRGEAEARDYAYDLEAVLGGEGVERAGVNPEWLGEGALRERRDWRR